MCPLPPRPFPLRKGLVTVAGRALYWQPLASCPFHEGQLLRAVCSRPYPSQGTHNWTSGDREGWGKKDHPAQTLLACCVWLILLPPPPFTRIDPLINILNPMFQCLLLKKPTCSSEFCCLCSGSVAVVGRNSYCSPGWRSPGTCGIWALRIS
jgi:hypothetical protein